MPELEVTEIRELAVARLRRAGLNEEDARIVVDHMLAAELWGRSSHGLSLRLSYALRQAEEGAAAVRPEVVRDGGHFLVVNGNNGFGYLAGHMCAHLLVERARAHEVAAVALKNTRHTGMLGYYVHMAAREGVVAMCFGNCCPLMAPYGGSRALLGTNPLAFGFPAEPDPIIVDMATSEVSYGEVMQRQEEGAELPPGCALDSEGRPTRDPAAARAGALVPFGGHRGGALALAVQLLAGALTGSPAVPPPGRDYGLLLVGFSRGAFAGDKAYDEAVAAMIERYLSVPPLPDMEVRLPGARRLENYRQKRDGKLPVSAELAQALGIAGS